MWQKKSLVSLQYILECGLASSGNGCCQCLKYGGITAQMGSDKINVGSDKTHVGQ